MNSREWRSWPLHSESFHLPGDSRPFFSGHLGKQFQGDKNYTSYFHDFFRLIIKCFIQHVDALKSYFPIITPVRILVAGTAISNKLENLPLGLRLCPDLDWELRSCQRKERG